MTQTADDDGVATFIDIDWSGGTAVVSAHSSLADTTIASQVGVTEDDEVQLIIQRNQPLENLVNVNGSLAGMLDEDNNHTMTATAPGSTFSQTSGPDFFMRVQSGVDFRLIGLEWYPGTPPSEHGAEQFFEQWAVIEVDALEDDAEIDFDFSGNTVTPSTLEGSFSLPAREDSPLRTDGWGYLTVRAKECFMSGFMGAPILSDLSADTTQYEYTVEYIEPEWVEIPVTRYMVGGIDADWIALSVMDGFPTEGAVDPELLDLPTMVTPAEGGDPHPLHDAMEWELYDEGVGLRLDVQRNSNLYWTVEMPVDSTSLTLPTLPDDFDEADVLGNANVTAQLVIYRNLDDDPVLERATFTHFFPLDL